jgi:hypothetical protein
MPKDMDILDKMGETQRWRPNGEVEIVWNDKVLCVVDRTSGRVVVMVLSWMTELEVSLREPYGQFIGAGGAPCRKE